VQRGSDPRCRIVRWSFHGEAHEEGSIRHFSGQEQQRMRPWAKSWRLMAQGAISTGEPPAVPPSLRLRVSLTLAAALLTGVRTSLWASSQLKARDFDQVWFAARVLFSGGNPYHQIGPGRAFDWPAPFYYPLTAVLAISPLALAPRTVASILFAMLGSAAFVWAATRRSIGPAVVISSASAALAAEAVQWSPLLGAAFGMSWLAVLLCAKPTIGFAVWAARPSLRAVVGGLLLSLAAMVLLPSWPLDWLAALRHTSLAKAGGTPYFAPIGSLGGMSAVFLLARWRRPEARLVLALACVPQTPLLYETVPLFLVPLSLTEGGVLWLGSWIAAAWLALSGPFPDELARFTTSARAIGLFMYLPCVIMILRRPNVSSDGNRPPATSDYSERTRDLEESEALPLPRGG
jgi:hypothetical protein